MNLVLAFTLWTGSPGGGRLPAPQDPWFGRDKLMHVTASALIQSAAHSAFRWRGASYQRASWAAAAVTATSGVGKELWDRHRKRDFSYRDLAWDGIGSATAAVVIRQVDR
jgi:putative lipoprotein